MYPIVTVTSVVAALDKVAVNVATPAAFSAIDVVPVKVTVGIVSLSVIVTVACCVPFSVTPLALLTEVMSAITVSEPSKIASSVGSIVTVPVKEPAGIVIVTLDAA